MRYVRFLKPPRVVGDESSPQRHVSCLITVTSDLGDSFLAYQVPLVAELLACEPSERVVVWSTVQWIGGMRALAVKLPLPRSSASVPLRLKIGTSSKTTCDDFSTLFEGASRGVVSAWSAVFGPSVIARKLVERRFMLSSKTVSIWEETGESIARHLWDAGITLSCHLDDLLDESSELAMALLPSGYSAQPRVIELGTGCGIVGISLAQLIEGADIVLTDLPEAREVVERNLKCVEIVARPSIRFEELDWNAKLPSSLQSESPLFNLILAADCTYNADSSPALVETVSRLVNRSPSTVVAVAMKMRHSSEEVFFELMASAAFNKVRTILYPLPGDDEDAEDTVYLHVYRYSS